MSWFRSRLVQNVGAMSLLQAANYLVPLLAIPYLTRVLQPEMFGHYAFTQILMAWFVTVTNFGFPWSTTREIAANQQHTDRVARLFLASWSVQLALTVVCGLAWSGLVLTVPMLSEHAALYVFGFSIVVGAALFPVWCFQGLERLKEVALIQIASRLAALGLTFLFVRQPDDAWLAILIHGSGAMVGGLASLAFLHRWQILGTTGIGLSDGIEAIRSSYAVFASQALFSLYLVLVPTALSSLVGATAVGHLSLAERVRTAGQSLMQPLSQALFPRLSYLFGSRRTSEAIRLVRYSLAVTASISIFAGIAIFVLADPIVYILGGPSFAPAANVLRWLSIAPLFVNLNKLIAFQILLPLGHQRVYNIVYAAAAVVGAGLILPMTAALGTVGSVLTILLVEAMVLTALSASVRSISTAVR